MNYALRGQGKEANAEYWLINRDTGIEEFRGTFDQCLEKLQIFKVGTKPLKQMKGEK